MLSALFTLFSRAVAEALNTIGQTAGGLVFSILGVGLGLVFAYARRGSEGVRFDLHILATALTPLIALWLVVLAWHLVGVPYRAYQQQRDTATRATALVAELEKSLEQRRHAVDMTEPGVRNMLGVIAAFQKYRGSIGPLLPASGPHILVSAAEDSTQIAWQVTQWAVFGSGIGNGDLQNIGVKPENLDVESRRGMVPKVLLVHVVRQTPEVLALVDDLSPLIPPRLVYTMPDTQNPIPSNIIWLQFGPGVRWASEMQQNETAPNARDTRR
jgi:hypothetical protein